MESVDRGVVAALADLDQVAVGATVMVGLSGVGPPPTSMMSHPLWKQPGKFRRRGHIPRCCLVLAMTGRCLGIVRFK